MKANELRLGNYVWNDTQGIEVKVDIKILSECYYREQAKVDIGWMPVPLTEIHFIKFKAKKIDNDSNNYFCFKDAYLRFAYDSDLKCWYCSIGNDDNGFLFTIIKYVHQLQNLHFSFNREELTETLK